MTDRERVLAWLLDAYPSIRWQMMRDLTDAPADEIGGERRVEPCINDPGVNLTGAPPADAD
jgi:hypothetical protein